MSRQKNLDADFQKTNSADKSDNGLDADDIQNKFILKILEKVQKTKLKFSQGSITLL